MPQQVYDLIEKIPMNSYTWGGPRSKERTGGVQSVDALAAIESILAWEFESTTSNVL